MAEPAIYKPKIAADAARFLVQLFAGFFAATIARRVAHFGDFLSLTIGLGVFYLLDYWTPPKPRISFAAWLLRIVLITGYLVLGLWLIPNLLSHFLWSWLAYGVSAFLLVLSSYWIPLVRETKRTSLRQTLIFAAVLAIVFAIFGPAYVSGH